MSIKDLDASAKGNLSKYAQDNKNNFAGMTREMNSIIKN